MKFVKYIPAEQLKPYIKYFAISENEMETEYKVFPSAGLVIGFQYKGKLATIQNGTKKELSSAGVTGISNQYKIFKNSANIGTVLVFFTEIGFTHFSAHPANELFNLSLSLSEIFAKDLTNQVEEKLSLTTTDKQRIDVVEQFLASQLKNIQTDKLFVKAIELIYESKGTIRISELNKILSISQSPFEKRFRKLVGTSPKKLASIIRFNSVLETIDRSKPLTAISYENNFFDQAHFIKNFKQFTGDTPENFKRRL